MERLMNLATLPRNALGDRAGPRYHLKTLRLAPRGYSFAEHGELR
jgi:hypothetical protein